MFPNVTVAGFECDVTQRAALERALDGFRAKFGGKRIGALFANAGVIFLGAGVLGSDLDDWKRTYDVNVHGVVRFA